PASSIPLVPPKSRRPPRVRVIDALTLAIVIGEVMALAPTRFTPSPRRVLVPLTLRPPPVRAAGVVRARTPLLRLMPAAPAGDVPVAMVPGAVVMAPEIWATLSPARAPVKVTVNASGPPDTETLPAPMVVRFCRATWIVAAVPSYVMGPVVAPL